MEGAAITIVKLILIVIIKTTICQLLLIQFVTTVVVIINNNNNNNKSARVWNHNALVLFLYQGQYNCTVMNTIVTVIIINGHY